MLKNCAARSNQGVAAAINGNIEIDTQAIHILMLIQALLFMDGSKLNTGDFVNIFDNIAFLQMVNNI